MTDVVKGYKGMESDMTCRGMQFEVGRAYHVDGEIELCYNGLHFCKNLNEVFEYYPRDGNRFFEVEAYGVIKTNENKSVTSDLRIIRELTDIEINNIEINRMDYGKGYGKGYCYGNGYDYGYGYDYSNGYGNGYDCGYGDGNGYGDGKYFSDGNGNGYGYDYGDRNIQRILLFV